MGRWRLDLVRREGTGHRLTLTLTLRLTLTLTLTLTLALTIALTLPKAPRTCCALVTTHGTLRTAQAWLLDAAYPLLRDAALFFEGQLRPATGAGDHGDHGGHGDRGGRGGHGDGNGTLRFSVPAHSPENSYVSAEQAGYLDITP